MRQRLPLRIQYSPAKRSEADVQRAGMGHSSNGGPWAEGGDPPIHPEVQDQLCRPGRSVSREGQVAQRLVTRPDYCHRYSAAGDVHGGV